MPHIHTGDCQFDYTVAGYLVHKNKTLLIKHKYLPIWVPPSGHVELDQTPTEALFTEIKEETGIDVSDLEIVETQPYPANFKRGKGMALPLPFDLEYHTITDSHRHINLAYIVKTNTNDIQPGPGESNTSRWFSADELKRFNETNDSILSSALFALEYTNQEVR